MQYNNLKLKRRQAVFRWFYIRSLMFCFVISVILALFTAIRLFAVGFSVKEDDEKRNECTVKTDFPMFTGETLVYTFKWEPPWYMFFLPKMEAGELTFKFLGIEEYRGKPVVKIVIEARSSGALAKLADIKVEDEFIFYSDPETLCAEGSVSKIREGKRKRQLEVEYFQDERRLIFRAYDESVTPPQLQKDVTKSDLPQCVRDPFSTLYFYRTLPLVKGYEKIIAVGNDDKVLEVHTRIEKQESVPTPAGKVVAWKIRTDALRDGLFSQEGDFRIWMATDEHRAPVRFEANVRLGNVLGVLKKRSQKPGC